MTRFRIQDSGLEFLRLGLRLGLSSLRWWLSSLRIETRNQLVSRYAKGWFLGFDTPSATQPPTLCYSTQASTTTYRNHPSEGSYSGFRSSPHSPQRELWESCVEPAPSYRGKGAGELEPALELLNKVQAAKGLKRRLP